MVLGKQPGVMKKAGLTFCICTSIASPYLACTEDSCPVHEDLPAEQQRSVESWNKGIQSVVTVSGTNTVPSNTTTTTTTI